MIYLQTFLYYIFISSIVLIYGIGLSSFEKIGTFGFESFTYYLKSILSILGTTTVGFVITNFILFPLNLIELFPFVCFLVFIVINTFLEALVRLTTGKSAVEFSISFLIVLLSIMESNSILKLLTICLSSFVSILLMIPICLVFKTRVCSNGEPLNERYCSFIFLFLAILLFVMSVCDTSWLNFGVLK